MFRYHTYRWKLGIFGLDKLNSIFDYKSKIDNFEIEVLRKHRLRTI